MCTGDCSCMGKGAGTVIIGICCALPIEYVKHANATIVMSSMSIKKGRFHLYLLYLLCTRALHI